MRVSEVLQHFCSAGFGRSQVQGQAMTATGTRYLQRPWHVWRPCSRWPVPWPEPRRFLGPWSLSTFCRLRGESAWGGRRSGRVSARAPRRGSCARGRPGVGRVPGRNSISSDAHKRLLADVPQCLCLNVAGSKLVPLPRLPRSGPPRAFLDTKPSKEGETAYAGRVLSQSCTACQSPGQGRLVYRGLQWFQRGEN